jgi:hypothetical protein
MLLSCFVCLIIPEMASKRTYNVLAYFIISGNYYTYATQVID